MKTITTLITEHIDIWTAAETEKKSGRGRASGNSGSVYGVKKLRDLILELAVRGKLVPQNANDEPASELLKRIQAEKAKLIAEGEIKKDKLLSPITEDEKPFELPGSWMWTTLACVSLVNPRNNADDNLPASFVPMTMIGARFNSQHEQESRLWKEIKQGFTHFAEGDIGVAKITPCFENSKACVFSGLQSEIGAGTTELHIVRPINATLAPRFILAYLKSPRFLLVGESRMTGTAGQKRLPKEFVESNPFPLPPLAEQHRIVAKVDELMALCDQLENQHSNAVEAHETLVSQLLGTLTQSQNAEDFSANWQRIAAHFDTLFTSESSIDALKQTLLQLAVMGKLVPQDANDEPASELLKRIQTEKAKLIAEGKIKKDKPLPPITDDEKPFELPNGWEWVRFGNALISRDAERIPVSSDERQSLKGEYDYYGASGVIDRINQFLFDKPLLLIGEDGANLINRSTPIAFIARGKYWVNNHAHVLDGISENFLRYVELYINSIDLKPYVTGTAQPKMNQAKMNSIVLGLPSAKEQHRVVAKVDELMALCDKLKSRITDASRLQQKLADVLVEQAVA